MALEGNRKLLFFSLKSKYEYIIHRLSKCQRRRDGGGHYLRILNPGDISHVIK